MQTNEGQRNFAELRKKFEPKQAQLKTEADEIDALKKQLQTAGATLSDADRQTRLQAIDTKEKAYQRTGEDAQNDFQQEMAQTYQQLAEKVYGSLNTYATENGFGVVLDAAATEQQPPTVLWHVKETDITLAVVQAYNVKSGVPAPAAVPSAPTPSHSTTPHAPSPK
jgi:outer membrane protein